MPSYANAKSAETRIREALLHRLGQITTGNGYLNTLGEIHDDFPEDPDSIAAFPAAVLLTGYEGRDRYDSDMLYVSLKAFLLVFVEPDGYGSVVEAIESVKQDVHSMLGNYPGLPGSDNEVTCQRAVFSSAEPFGRVLDLPLASNHRGVRIGIDVAYQQTLIDPTVT
jgi:hypothetical protein